MGLQYWEDSILYIEMVPRVYFNIKTILFRCEKKQDLMVLLSLQ